jgi:Translationally controlled tumour protein
MSTTFTSRFLVACESPCLTFNMIIYKCRFTGDEMLSDAFKPTPVPDADGSEVPGLIQIKSQKVNKVGEEPEMDDPVPLNLLRT